MNLGQLYIEINKDLDDTLNSGDLLGWINRCMDDLSPIAKKEAKTSYEITSNEFELPEDLMEIIRVVVKGEDVDRTQYSVWANTLSFNSAPTSGTMELYYYRRLAQLTGDISEVPEIDPTYHDVFILYTIAHQQFMEDEPERQMDAMERYYRRKNEYEAFMRRNNVRFNPKTKIQNVYSEWWS
jgi:hypothetical protein